MLSLPPSEFPLASIMVERKKHVSFNSGVFREWSNYAKTIGKRSLKIILSN